MPKYLLQISYTLDGVKGVVSKGGSARQAAASGGGRERRRNPRVDLFRVRRHRCLRHRRPARQRRGRGVGAQRDGSGGATVRTVVLLTPEEIDAATSQKVQYTPPARSRDLTGSRDSSVARGDRPVGLGRPVAPRAGVETGVGDPGDRHRQQVVAGGDAAAAVHDRRRSDDRRSARRARRADRWRPSASRLSRCGRLIAPGMWPALRIDRFDLAAVPLGRPGVDQGRAALDEVGDVVGVDDAAPALDDRVAGRHPARRRRRSSAVRPASQAW